MLKNIFIVLTIALAITGCNKTTDVLNTTQPDSGIEGQLYANAGPGFHLEKTIATIVALKNDTTTHVSEAKSDTNGVFRINLEPGKYMLYVKESHDIYYSGPFEVAAGNYTQAKAYLYDSRID